MRKSLGNSYPVRDFELNVYINYFAKTCNFYTPQRFFSLFMTKRTRGYRVPRRMPCIAYIWKYPSPIPGLCLILVRYFNKQLSFTTTSVKLTLRGVTNTITDLQSFTLMMASAQVVETSVNTNNSPSQDYTSSPDDH